jgi:hypothetical protein
MWSEANIRNQYPSIISEVFPDFFFLSVDIKIRIWNPVWARYVNFVFKFLSVLLCKFCYLRNSWFWYNFPVVIRYETICLQLSRNIFLPLALLSMYIISAISLPACVMHMTKCHQVITSLNRCSMQHYVIQGWTDEGRFRTVAGTCCIVCVNDAVVYTARVEYD